MTQCAALLRERACGERSWSTSPQLCHLSVHRLHPSVIVLLSFGPHFPLILSSPHKYGCEATHGWRQEPGQGWSEVSYGLVRAEAEERLGSRLPGEELWVGLASYGINPRAS